ncbi:MAG: hypothetical protein WBA77_11375 [Microcoleaceae cyanobacterium]
MDGVLEIPQIAKSAMWMGDAYAKAEETLYSSIDLSKDEIIEADFEPIESNSSPVLEKEFLDNTDYWTKKY